MTSPVEPPQSGDGANRPGLVSALARKPRELAYTFFGLAALFTVVPIALLVRNGWPGALGPLFMWGVLAALTSLGAALVALLWKPEASVSETEKVRLLLLCLGGALGLLTAVILGLVVPFFEPYRSIFAGGVTEWRKHPGPVFLVVIAFVGGLSLTFVSMQAGRGRERESALMRRLMYGFNAVFSTLLLATILLILNFVPYMPALGAHDFVHKFFAGTFDWTQARIYSLSERTKNTLENLKEPVKVYVFLDNADPITEQVKTLLENCRGVNPRLTWEQVSSGDADRFQQLPQKLQEKVLDRGLLVVYGPESQGQAQFIPRRSLFTVQQDETAPRLLFKGEGALMLSIRSLAENAEKKPVVYFAQGDGELDFADEREDSADGVGVLLSNMRQSEIYELKELKFGGDVTAVPADAQAVVVVRPRKMKAASLKAIYAYMGYAYDETAKTAQALPPGQVHKVGKLFVLLDVQVEGGKMLQTGLEPLLLAMGAQAVDARVLTLQNPGRPEDIEAAASRSSRNPVAKAFTTPNRAIFHFHDARPVKRSFGAPGPFTSEELVVTESEPVWEETDLVTPPATIAKERIQQPGAKYSDQPISLAVAVSERKADLPNDAAHAGLSGEGQPRLVAFGNAGWLSNDGLLGSEDKYAKYALFTSCLSWLREKPDIGATPVEADETKSRVPYMPSISADASWNLQLLPLAEMVLVIVAGGIGVWLVRRR